MRKPERYQAVLEHFRKTMPVAETELDYSNPYELVCAVALSAQCTDKRVNMVTPHLFEAYPDFVSLSQANVDDVREIIASISYPNNKAKHLVAMANTVLDEFNGELPMDVKQLVKLQGVGRKTANVVVSVLDQQPAMAVDTHVFRVSARIGLTTSAKTPLQAETQLTKFIPSDEIHLAHHWLILHGRYTCLARSPKCDKCEITEYCKYYAKEQRAAQRKLEKEQAKKQ